MRAVLSILFFMLIFIQIAALVLCGPIGFTMVSSMLFWEGMCIWKLWKWKKPTFSARLLISCWIIFLMFACLSWYALPHMTFSQAQEAVCELPENRTAHVLTQRWSEWLTRNGPALSKSEWLDRTYLVIIISEKQVANAYFVNPTNGTIFRENVQ